MSATESVAPAVQAQCPKHPDRAAQGTCARCGVFVCGLDFKLLDGKTYCDTCAALPQVDYLEAFRLKYWGKRDGWAWLFLLGVPLNLLQVVGAIAQSQVILTLAAVFAVVVDVCFFLGLAWARVGVLLLPPAFVLAIVAESAGGDPNAMGRALGAAVGGSFIPMLMSVAIFNDTRNQLFFKVHVPREKLRKTWDLLCNNTVARQGLILSLFSLLAFPFAPIALVLSIVGLRRVDPNATPPIGRKGQAIAGIVISALACVEGVAIVLLLRANP